MNCELCTGDGGVLIWRHPLLRVVLVDEADYPGFCRVIWNAHVREMTDLSRSDAALCMAAVFAVEDALRLTLQPTKINLASLGNMTPHVHWHVIPRFVEDRHFPRPVWAEPLRPAFASEAVVARLPALRAALIESLRNI